MLPHAFLDWWFAPWSYANGGAPCLPLASDQLSRRDGYRLWCAEAQVRPGLPPAFDPVWALAATSDGAALAATARLFAGLLAARGHVHEVLAGLPFADHRWCVTVAATQPLLPCAPFRHGADEAIELHGLLELARHLEHGFPGLWQRLRLTLPVAQANEVERLRQEPLPLPNMSDAAIARAQRCWQLCRGRAESALPARRLSAQAA
ncbi:hypothetical protein [Collimonas humicola]|uniref:hypothetical protein n=1 Tax=Collimonas humicola TaxID=2825886 RepID=UPI001B8C157A|nr:hypothetical protein [Collimonas humicola]